MDLSALIQSEGWRVVPKLNGKQKIYQVSTPYDDDLGLLKVQHPSLIHLEIYRKHTSPEFRYQHLKKAHDILWPTDVVHEWTKRRFMTHCENWNYITLAAGASAAKSFDEAKYGIMFWYANPSERSVIIASTTLSSLMTRVWGYLTAHMKRLAVPLPYKYYRSNPPRILLEEPSVGKNKIDDDTLHGIFAVTAKAGDDDQAVATWIGKHPKDKLLVVLDEATDMPLSILNALPNLNSHPEKFQLVAIGNSNSTMDLHGLLSTPENGWDSVSTELIQWNTTQMNGTCLYFSPYESPAITHPDPAMRKVLEKFLVGETTLREKEIELGKDSEKFYRWVLGFWKSRSTENVTVSEKFLKDVNPRQRPEYSGYYPIQRVAGLDPAFSSDGDGCILRIGNVGHSYDNLVKLDLMEESMIFDIPLIAMSDVPMERQVAEKAVDLLTKYGVLLEHLGIDVTGQGRAIGEVIHQINEKRGFPLGQGQPLKIYSMSPHNVNKRKKSAPDIIPISSFEIWETIRMFIEKTQVCGLDAKTIYQLTNRKILVSKSGKKSLESKRDYRTAQGAIGKAHSPDEADALGVLVQVLLRRLGIQPGTRWEPPQGANLDRAVQSKLYARGMQTQEQKQAAAVIESDFSGGLINYMNHKVPF